MGRNDNTGIGDDSVCFRWDDERVFFLPYPSMNLMRFLSSLPMCFMKYLHYPITL